MYVSLQYPLLCHMWVVLYIYIYSLIFLHIGSLFDLFFFSLFYFVIIIYLFFIFLLLRFVLFCFALLCFCRQYLFLPFSSAFVHLYVVCLFS